MALRALPDGSGTTTWRRLDWSSTIALHLVPAAITFAAALVLAPVMEWLHLPPSFALTVAFALVLTPLELGFLLRAAYRVTGRRSLRALPAVLAYRRPLGRWALLVPALFGFAVVLLLALTPVADALGGHLAGLYPHWLLPGYDPAKAGFSKTVLVATLLVTLLVDGIINPTVEECYFRAYLLPRLPVAGWRAVPLSAGLFAVQHYWQPQNWLLIFVLELVLTTLVRKLNSVRLSIVMHVLVNSFGTLAALVAVLN